MTTSEQIDGYMAFLNQTHNTSMAIVQQGDMWAMQINGNTIYTLPDKTIAQNLLTAFQSGAGPAIVQAQTDAKAAIVSLVGSL